MEKEDKENVSVWHISWHWIVGGILLAIMFAGEPDLIDAIIKILMNIN